MHSSDTSLNTADFNGDGDLDLVVVGSDKTLSINLGNGDGTFQASVGPVTSVSSSPAIGDLGGDGRLDLVAANSEDSFVSVLMQAQATTSVLSSSLNPSRYGQTITLSAVVVPALSGTPIGTVTFNDGPNTLASVPLNSGAATLTISTLTAMRCQDECRRSRRHAVAQ